MCQWVGKQKAKWQGGTVRKMSRMSGFRKVRRHCYHSLKLRILAMKWIWRSGKKKNEKVDEFSLDSMSSSCPWNIMGYIQQAFKNTGLMLKGKFGAADADFV